LKLGIFGGTFDPIHIAHLIVAEEATERLGLDEVLFVPAGQPWLKSAVVVTDARHRLAMVELAVESTPYFTVSDVEIRRSGPSYTADTLEELKRSLDGDADFYLIVGLDALREVDRWQRPRRVLELATLVGVARPGAEELDRGPLESVYPGVSEEVVVIDGPLIGISGTEIRARVRDGLSIRHRVPAPVESYIQEYGLYAAPQAAREAVVGGSRWRPEHAHEAEIILELAKRKEALKFGEFRLSAGGTSPYYFDGRLVTLDPEGAYHVARAFWPILMECGAEAIAGPTVGADPIVAAIAAMSFTWGHPMPGLIVRQEAKQHGTGRIIEGPLERGAAVAVVDDTCSTGGSLLHVIEAVEAEGCRVVKVMCILDRRQGGSDEIRRRGYDFLALLEADEDGAIAPVRGRG
jgi:nicotinate-nucleotide adenylyltransferase